jgi:dephospho-CoA kinase
MPRVLVTGMSGAGKSTLLEGLARRGHTVVDTDYDGWVLADGRWDEARMADLLERVSSIVVAGTVENQVTFYDRFDHVVLLSVPLETLLQRVTTRTSNPYGSRPEEREEIARYVQTVEPLLRRRASVELDGRDEPASLVALVEKLVSAS